MSSFVPDIKYSMSPLIGGESVFSIENTVSTKAKKRICILIDNSGSMSGSRINLVKHAAKALIKSSDGSIEIAIFTFSSRGVMVQQFYQMTEQNKDVFIQDITNIGIDGSTNLLAGLEITMNYIQSTLNPENIDTHLLVFTDGEPDNKNIVEYQRLLEPFYSDNKKPCVIDVFGFGNSLSLDILKQIYTTGSGIFAYISDINMIGTIFGNYFANLVSTTMTNVKVSYELENAEGTIEIKTIEIGNLQSLQKKLYILDQPAGFTIGYVSIEYTTHSGKEVERVETLPEIAVEEYQIDLIKLRNIVIHTLNMFIQGRISVHDAKRELNNVYDSFHVRFLTDPALLQYESVKEIQNLLFDIRSTDVQKGQILKAFDNTNGWGKYYLIALCLAHISQTTINFKDKSLKFYSGSVSKTAYDDFNAIFDTIPFVQASSSSYYSSSSSSSSYTTTAADYNRCGGGCFDGAMFVRILDQNLEVQNIQIKDLKRGHTLIDSNEMLKNIQFILKTKYSRQKMFNLNGLIGTDTHPIFINGNWIKMKDAPGAVEITDYDGEYLYTFSVCNIEEGNVNSSSFELNGIPCAAFGHGNTDKDVTHPEYSLLSSTFWGTRILDIFKIFEERGLLVNGTLTLECNYEYVRDEKSGWVVDLKINGIVY
jgi:uncharacterized protein YegL